MQGMRLFGAVLAVLATLGTGVALAQEDGSQAEAGVVELISERTATSETFRLADGQLETRIYEAPINYRDVEGRWKPIDQRLREADGGALTNGPNYFDVHLPQQVDAGPVRLSVGDHWVASQFLSADVEPVQLKGETASYEGSNPGVSIEYRGTTSGLKEEIVLLNPSQPSSFAFDLSASSDLTPSLDSDGGIRFRDRDGRVVVVLPAPVMSDSSPEQPAISRDIRYELSPERDGHWRLLVAVDPEWLEEPGRVFPVRLDPTMTVEMDLDCVIGGGTGETGWIDCAPWGREDLLVGYDADLDDEDDEWWRTLMDWDTSDLPSTADVASATFNIRSNESALNTIGVELRKITKDWTWQASWSRYDGPENLWDNEGGDYSDSLGEVLTSVRGNQAGWWQFDVPPEIVEEEVAEEEDMPVLMKLLDDKVKKCAAESCTERKIHFDSSSAENEEHRPYLSVIYDANPVVETGAATEVASES